MAASLQSAPPAQASPQQLPAWGEVPEAVVQQAFRDTSEEAREALKAIGLPVGLHILREDIPAALRAAAGRELGSSDMAALLRCFVLDSCAAIGWPEFERSWRALQQLGAAQPSQRLKTKRTGMATAAGGAPQLASQPATAQQEVGWHHTAAPLQRRERCEDATARYLPLRGTDVTRGGEGRSPATYFGMYL